MAMKENDSEFQELLSAYLDGELNPAQAEKLQRRLTQEEQAKALLDDLKKVSAMIGALPREKAPAFLAEEVQQEIERAALLSKAPAAAESAGRNHLLLRKLAAVAAMVMLLGAIGTIIYSILGKESAPAGTASSYTVPRVVSNGSPGEIFRSTMDSVREKEETVMAAGDSAKTQPREIPAAAPEAPNRLATAKSAEPSEAGEYGSIHLVVSTRHADASRDRIEQAFANAGITSVIRKQTQGLRQFAFLCSKAQLTQIYPDLNPSEEGPLRLRIASLGGTVEEFPLADLNQLLLVARTRGPQAQKQVAMDFSRKTSLNTPETDQELPGQPVEAWLNEMIAQARPEIKDLRNLGGVSPEIPCQTCPQAAEPLHAKDSLWTANPDAMSEEPQASLQEPSASAPAMSDEELVAVVLVLKEETP